MQAIILAGGRGKRLKPLTDNIPKPMVMVNKKPFLEHLIKLLIKNDIYKIILSVGYLKEVIMDHFKCRFRYSIEHDALGTGGALKLAEKYLGDVFFVIYGDSYLDIDYKKVMEYFKESNKKALIVVYDNKEDTGVNKNISAIVDRVIYYDKNDKTADYVDAGVLIFKKKVLKMIPKSLKVSLENEIFRKLIKENELIIYRSEKRFYDIGTIERLKEFKRMIK